MFCSSSEVSGGGDGVVNESCNGSGSGIGSGVGRGGSGNFLYEFEI